MNEITVSNIAEFSHGLGLDFDDFPSDWEEMFTLGENSVIVEMSTVISTKNQREDPKFLRGEKVDPRRTAYERMRAAAKGEIEKRPPVTAYRRDDGMLIVIDGNATVQVLMASKIRSIPVIILAKPA